jgi:hypothetical protein
MPKTTKKRWFGWMALVGLFAFLVAFPYLTDQTHSIGADLIHSSMFFIVFVIVFIIPFRFVFRGGRFIRGVLLFWCMFILHGIFLGICYASLPRSLGLPQPDFRGVGAALIMGWLPGLIVCSLALASRLIAERIRDGRDKTSPAA